MSAAIVQWGVAKVALGGQPHSGDAYTVRESPKGVLIAVVDGLGHGEEAAGAARMATEIAQAHNQEGIISLLRRCHEELRGSRGVVMSLAWIDKAEQSLVWAGVGNVEGVMIRANPEARSRREALLLRAGVLGDQLPALQATSLPLTEGDTIILATDGIRSDFGTQVKTDLAPQQIAAQILSQCGKGNDDALVLVARYVGDSR